MAGGRGGVSMAEAVAGGGGGRDPGEVPEMTRGAGASRGETPGEAMGGEIEGGLPPHAAEGGQLWAGSLASPSAQTARDVREIWRASG